MTPKCGQSKDAAHEPQVSVSLMFLPHFDVLFDLLLNRPRQHRNMTTNADVFRVYSEFLFFTDVYCVYCGSLHCGGYGNTCSLF